VSEQKKVNRKRIEAVEILQPAAEAGISPITAVKARRMLSSIKAAPLLKGLRGETGVNEKGIIEIIQRLSQLVTDWPGIQEIDLNPVIADKDRVAAVDARIGLCAQTTSERGGERWPTG
jgi:hypothetical protein